MMMHVCVCRYSNDELYEVPEGQDAPLSSETWSGEIIIIAFQQQQTIS